MFSLIIKPVTRKVGQGLSSLIYKEILDINKKNRNNPRWENGQKDIISKSRKKNKGASNCMKSSPTSLIMFKMKIKTRMNFYL